MKPTQFFSMEQVQVSALKRLLKANEGRSKMDRPLRLLHNKLN